MTVVLQLAAAKLTRLQREWLTEFEKDLHEHNRLNLARVARARGRDRSNALRALQALRDVCASLGAQDLL